MPETPAWPEGWSDRTLVRCTSFFHEYHTIVPPRIVDAIPRCMTCAGPLEVVRLAARPAPPAL